jgi:hypothetical protein
LKFDKDNIGINPKIDIDITKFIICRDFLNPILNIESVSIYNYKLNYFGRIIVYFIKKEQLKYFKRIFD